MKSILLENKEIKLEVDQETGTLYSLRLKKDCIGTEYFGNPENISYPQIHRKNQWMGDIRLRIWDGRRHEWVEEITADSEDTRKVEADPCKDMVIVSYQKPSGKEKGIRHVELREMYTFEKDGLHWYLSVKNPSQKILEIGELSLAFTANTDYTGIFEDPAYQKEEHWRGIKQKIWHEQRVQQHLSINGGSSYVFLQRPRGDYPALLFLAADNENIEEAYQMDKTIGCQWALTFEGPYYLALYSNGAKKCEGWKYETEQQRYGMNGNTSLVLTAGEERQFHFVFHPVFSEEERKEYLYQERRLDIDVQPSMVAPIGVPVKMRIRCMDEPELVPVANNMFIEGEKRDGNCYFYQLMFTEPGQKKLYVHHGGKRTTIMFYAIGQVEELIKKHADFIVRRQYYENPKDPYGRHHTFMPYDDALEMLFTESEESWQVGALDEYALPVAMFVAEKNVFFPDSSQIEVMEQYIDSSLYGKLQEKGTFYARRGLYYEDRTPSDIYFGNKWDKKTAGSIFRSFNYPLIMDIYFAMYKIAAKHGMTRIRTGEEYLEMAYRTAMAGYGLGRNKFNGAPAGATIVELLKVLKKERPSWYKELNRKILFIADENARSEYPFGSELYIDQTSHNQYEAMMRYYGKEEKLEEAYRVTCALRGGWQPQWFQYGNEKRGNVCCWYGTPLNSRVLFEGFDHTGDEKMLRLGMGGLFSFLTCIRSNGAAHGWFLCWPDRSGFDLRSLDTDMGMYGYLHTAKSYLVDDKVFGRSGYGCLWEKKGTEEIITPYDGLGVRFRSVVHDLEISCEKGRIKRICLDETKKKIKVELEKSINKEMEMYLTTGEPWVANIEGKRIETKAHKTTMVC